MTYRRFHQYRSNIAKWVQSVPAFIACLLFWVLAIIHRVLTNADILPGSIMKILSVIDYLMPISAALISFSAKNAFRTFFGFVDAARVANGSIDEFVRKVHKIFNDKFNIEDVNARKMAAKKLCACLKNYVINDIRLSTDKLVSPDMQIVRAVSDYNFIFVLGRFTEAYLARNENSVKGFRNVLIICDDIVNDYVESTKSSKETVDRKAEDKECAVAFAALYLQSYIYKKCLKWIDSNHQDVKSLEKDIVGLVTNDEYDKAFSRFPTFHEVKARGYKRWRTTDEATTSKEDRLLKALECDNKAIGALSALKDEGFAPNHAIYASYVSTLCEVLEAQKERNLVTHEDMLKDRRNDINQANIYIGECIKAHSNYPKYEYLKAKLYYREVTCLPWIGSIQDKVNKLHEASISCSMAMDRLQVCNSMIPSHSDDNNRYQELKNQIDETTSQCLSALVIPPIRLDSEAKSEENKRDEANDPNVCLKKPNEDYYRCDDKYGIYIVMDGITRPHDEYNNDSQPSSAKVCAEMLSGYLHDALKNNAKNRSGIDRIKDAIIQTYNDHESDIFKRNSEKKSEDPNYFDPGAVGIIAIVEKNKLYYLSMGDCSGLKLRHCAGAVERIYFGKQNSVEANDALRVSKAERYNNICNNKEHQYRYAIFNGDPVALELAEIGEITLSPGDVVFLFSDGIEPYFRYANGADILKLNDNDKTLEDNFRDSINYIKNQFRSYVDDRTAIKIKCSSPREG